MKREFSPVGPSSNKNSPDNADVAELLQSRNPAGQTCP